LGTNHLTGIRKTHLAERTPDAIRDLLPADGSMLPITGPKDGGPSISAALMYQQEKNLTGIVRVKAEIAREWAKNNKRYLSSLPENPSLEQINQERDRWGLPRFDVR
jgi:hypothetical protein